MSLFYNKLHPQKRRLYGIHGSWAEDEGVN